MLLTEFIKDFGINKYFRSPKNIKYSLLANYIQLVLEGDWIGNLTIQKDFSLNSDINKYFKTLNTSTDILQSGDVYIILSDKRYRYGVIVDNNTVIEQPNHLNPNHVVLNDNITELTTYTESKGRQVVWMRPLRQENIFPSKNLSSIFNILDYGAKGDGITDDTAAIQAAVNAASTAAGVVYVPIGNFAVKSTSAAITIAGDDIIVEGPGHIVTIANASGYAPYQAILVTGDRNRISINIWNSGDIEKQTSTESFEYPMDGIRVTGSDNIVQNSKVFNFVTPINIRGGVGNKVIYNTVTVKPVSNYAWPNDGILWFNTVSGICSGNSVGMALDPTNLIQFEDVTGASTSDLRCGITVDAITASIDVIGNIIGEGFVAGIHHEGTGDRQNIVSNNTIYKQRRNGINAAGSKIIIRDNILLGTFNTDTTVNLTGIIGSIQHDTSISGNYIFSDQSVPGIFILANTDDIQIQNNFFYGTFDNVIKGVANRINISGNHLDGTAARFAYIDRPSAGSSKARFIVSDNICSILTDCALVADSGHVISAVNNHFNFGEGFTGSHGVFEIKGGYSGDTVNIKSTCIFNANTVLYTGTTVIVSTEGFIYHPTSSSAPYLQIIGNTFDPAIFTVLETGNYVNAAKVFKYANSSTDGSAVGDTKSPATNTDSYIPQWDGANSKLLKNGLAVPAGGLAGLTALADYLAKSGGTISNYLYVNGTFRITGTTNIEIGVNASGTVFDAYSAGASLIYKTQSTERMRIDNHGNMGIGTASPNANAILDASSTTKAFMPPRMTTTQKAAIASPTSGMVVYDSTLNKLCVYGASTWETITSV